MMASRIKKSCSCFKKTEMCKKNIYIVFETLSDLNKTSNPAVTNTYNMHENWCPTVRVICVCDQCDSAFCALQLTVLIKPN